MYAFAYVKPKSVADAVSMMKEDGDGKLLAGGQTLLQTLKQRLAQ
ncbi:MAG: FAD binding domain-containing protein, partial [Elsteraceae bacterium]